METRKKSRAAVVIPRKRAMSGLETEGLETEGLETEIVIESQELQSEHPHCSIPPWYFERPSERRADEMRPLFSVHTWDGRNVLTIEGSTGDE